MSVLVALQKLIVDRLRADAAVSAMIGQRIYDSVPAKAVYPYVSFGAHDYVPDDAECIAAGEHTIMLDVWSEKPGRVEAKQVVDAVRRSLRQYDADLGAYGLVEMEIDFADVIMDPDGLTAHGRVQVRARIEEPE